MRYRYHRDLQAPVSSCQIITVNEQLVATQTNQQSNAHPVSVEQQWHIKLKKRRIETRMFIAQDSGPIFYLKLDPSCGS